MVLAAGTTFHSNIDGLDGDFLHGWAFSREDPEYKLRLAVYVDGEVEAEVRADIKRLDLESNDVIVSDCAFFVKLRPELFDGQTHAVALRELETHRGLASIFVDFPMSVETESTPKSGGDRSAASRWGNFYTIFDEDFYTRQAGPVPDPLAHFQQTGWRLNYDPHPMFSTRHYVKNRLAALDCDPVTDFFATSAHAMAEVHPLFDVLEYLKNRPDVAEAGIHPLLHYLTRGWKEGMRPSGLFDEDYYEEQCPGLRELGFIPVVHYLTNGWREGKRPHRDFIPSLFGKLARLDSTVEPFTHFVTTLKDRAHQAPQVLELPNASSKTTRVSILILNLEKWLLTAQCIHFLNIHTDLTNAEIIILDNGSSPPNFGCLAKYCLGPKIVRLPSNHGFGEGNNIAFEASSGYFTVLLNNDVFVTQDWLTPLLDNLSSSSEIGAVGPMFLYPDSSLQEAGALISADGSVVQLGKHLNPADPLFQKPRTVDYCSAAALVLRSADFQAVLGFDLCWDPAYYEDADLCLKLRLMGKVTRYVPASKVYHIENGTSSDAGIGLRLNNIVAANRLKFVGRWGAFLSDGDTQNISYLAAQEPAFAPVDASPARYRLALYTPYPLYPGGGERYLLSLATAVKGWADVTLFTPERVSRLRLMTMAREMALDLAHVSLATWEEVARHKPFDFFIAMGNEVLPPVAGIARTNVFHCQFPFEMSGSIIARSWHYLSDYDEVIVNSRFTKDHYLREAAKLGLKAPPVTILNPPVPLKSHVARDIENDIEVILNIGRFAPGGHCKRQDIMIDTFRALSAYSDKPLELHLAGALGQSYADREYLLGLQDRARDLPIHFHVNASPAIITGLYQRSDIYWHCTGIQDDVRIFPERFEHFGITIVEAMSAGMISVVLGEAGPAEIITHGKSGFLVGSARELEATTYAVTRLPWHRRAEITKAASTRAQQFSEQEFARKILTILSKYQCDEGMTELNCIQSFLPLEEDDSRALQVTLSDDCHFGNQ